MPQIPYTRQTTIRRSFWRRHALLLTVCAIIIIAAGIGGYFIARHIHDVNLAKHPVSPKQPQGNVLGNSGSSSSDNSRGTSSSGNASSTGGSSKSASNTGSGSGSSTNTAPPTAPSGTFVSSHYSSISNTEASTCNTSPGASCTITFTSGSTTKSLDSKTADASGAVYWTWKPSDIGLSVGTWKITATATLHGKTASTTDPKPLTVQS